MTKYVDIFLRHRVGFLLVMVCLPLAISALLVLRYPSATAAGSLWAESPASLGFSPSQATDWNPYLSPAQNASTNLSEFSQTGAFKEQVTARLDRERVWQNSQERSDTLGAYTTNLIIAPVGSHLLKLWFTCPRGELCVQVLQATIDIYKQSLDQQQQQQAGIATTFYRGQLAQAQNTLHQDQSALDAYLASNPSLAGLTQPSSAASGTTAAAISPAGATSQPTALAQLTQQVQTDQANIQALQTKLDSASFNSSAANELNNSALKVVDKPQAYPKGTLGSLPKQKLAIAWGSCVGLGLAVLFLLGWLDRSAGDARDIQRALGVPVLAQIPLLR